jgi:copper(I)-binding protein
MKKFFLLFVSLVSFILFNSLHAATAKTEGKLMEKSIVISNLFIRETAPHQKTGAAYLNIENKNNVDIKLVKVTVPAGVAKTTQLNKKAKFITIPKHSEFKLEMGGYHVMLIGLKKTLKEEDNITVPMIFYFEDTQGNEISVRAEAPIQNVFTIQPFPNVH